MFAFLLLTGTELGFKLKGAEVLCLKILKNWNINIVVDKVALLALIY